LPARHVIHTVGPVWHGGRSGEAELLASCYRRSLELALASDLKSIAFPAISCGAFGYPLEAATPIAVGTVRAFERLDALERVLFACANAEVLGAYQAALRQPGNR
jgi:O-acetyl-ADP-ribose deacetylase (regulator of RNase III)